MSEQITIALNADGFYDLVPTTGFFSKDTSQKVDSLMEFEKLEIAERYQELWNNTSSQEGVEFLIRMHSYEQPHNYRLDGALLTRVKERFV